MAKYLIGWPALEFQKKNICTATMRNSKIPKFCIGVFDNQDSVFSKFQAFLYSFTLAIDKTVLGGQVPNYVQYLHAACPKVILKEKDKEQE